MKPWYLRWWGIAFLGYLAVTGVLGVVFLTTSRRPPPAPLDTLRVGGFTPTESRVESPDAPVGASRKSKGTDTATVPIVTDGDPAIGAPADQAALTIVEFSDFQCPFCRAAFPIIREAVATFGNRGLRFVYRDFPVDEIHDEARLAAEAAQCAHREGKFWAYHDKLFQEQTVRCPPGISCAEGYDRDALVAYAEQVGLERQRFEVCLAAREFAPAVEEDYQAGVKLGVRGTPTWFFISKGDATTARRVEGVIPREALTQLLERQLR